MSANRQDPSPNEPRSMSVGVAGLGHLGSVTAVCMAASGFSVTGFDENHQTVKDLLGGRPPVFEPGLEVLVGEGLTNGRLRFTSRPEDLGAADIVWVAYDTPLDEEDRADVELVIGRIVALFPLLRPDVLMLISSQLPVGSTRRLEGAYRKVCPVGRAVFAYSPENVRLGKAIQTFSRPERIVVGTRRVEDQSRFEPLLRSIPANTEWMSVESAEMTKHAINAFLATSVAFMNELALLCENTGADARQVERGLKTDERIGQRAYLRPGAAFAGGTLARDIAFLEAIGRRHSRETPLFSAVRTSNNAHKQWPRRKLVEMLGDLAQKRIAILGLTYKPGTDTLQRSSSLEFCHWLFEQGAEVSAFDPVVDKLPATDGEVVHLGHTPEEVLRGAAAMIVGTRWPEFERIKASDVVAWMSKPATVIDPEGFLAQSLGNDPRIRYVSVGSSNETTGERI